MTDSDRLDAIISETLELEVGRVADTAFGVTPAWDSIGHLMLVAAIEEQFQITLDADDVVAMTDYLAVKRTLREKHGLDLRD